MKRIVSNSAINHIPDEKFAYMSTWEKKIIGKAKNSTDPEVYLAGVADTIDTLKVETTEEFSEFLNAVIQHWDF